MGTPAPVFGGVLRGERLAVPGGVPRGNAKNFKTPESIGAQRFAPFFALRGKIFENPVIGGPSHPSIEYREMLAGLPPISKREAPRMRTKVISPVEVF